MKLNADVGSFEVDFGEVVTDIVIYGKDKAGNFIGNVTAIDPDAATNTDKTPLKFEFNTTDYAWHMASNAICLDGEAPKLTVDLTVGENGGFVQAARNTDYYSDKVSLKFTIEEINLEIAQLKLSYTLDGKTEAVAVNFAENKVHELSWKMVRCLTAFRSSLRIRPVIP